MTAELARPPGPPPVYLVCPHCKRTVQGHVFAASGVMISTAYCAEHGDVVAIPSAVCNSPGRRAT